MRLSRDGLPGGREEESVDRLVLARECVRPTRRHGVDACQALGHGMDPVSHGALSFAQVRRAGRQAIVSCVSWDASRGWYVSVETCHGLDESVCRFSSRLDEHMHDIRVQILLMLLFPPLFILDSSFMGYIQDRDRLSPQSGGSEEDPPSTQMITPHKQS